MRLGRLYLQQHDPALEACLQGLSVLTTENVQETVPWIATVTVTVIVVNKLVCQSPRAVQLFSRAY